MSKLIFLAVLSSLIVGCTGPSKNIVQIEHAALANLACNQLGVETKSIEAYQDGTIRNPFYRVVANCEKDITIIFIVKPRTNTEKDV